MELLVLGGTAFLGREIARTAIGRGHRVTCAARGSSAPPEGAEFVPVDRDQDDGLAPVADRHWDGVIDVARQPGHMRRAVRDMAADHRVFVSSGNAYADFSAIEQSEDAATLAPLEADDMTSDDDYGAAKVACEQAVRTAGPSAVVRSGLIAGPGDWSGRTGYWPWRFAHPVGAEVVVPDDPDFPCAMIDVRDLAAWLVDLAEGRVEGTFNATGPTTDLRSVLDVAARVAGSSAQPRPGRHLTRDLLPFRPFRASERSEQEQISREGRAQVAPASAASR
ncbi:NAD-dependent epimerase/dehydratase family protein [Aeromicrobium duanguangcaii]|uniref:NAD-dependent epimerase/dehydratase family protein n=1 Tax=Aeromicrobium duanguangcaii TaxID=2968086 RepID=A0ABY5KC04_9ACTN|nr:NAD-dependent epimerase/dehydratase family protein [Aeromicrobium duanguangcaii]MCD9154608.1 NAD-dependent epimerase/dehydratase family protein [Aeromicrobium duanguangcaii]UUI67977.1 NAD-dependent epimerase/dehydratase family protein [Aeromicrobium duanguangcaii]